jgi:hypothetical protein
MHCQGHSGTSTAEYTAWVLPGRIWVELSLADLTQVKVKVSDTISALLLEEITKFDK